MKTPTHGSDFTRAAKANGGHVNSFGPTHMIATDSKGRSVVYPKGEMRPSVAGVVVKIFKLMAFLAFLFGAWGWAIRQ